MLHLSASVTYYFYSQAVDMRKGVDSLSLLVQAAHTTQRIKWRYIYFHQQKEQPS